MLRYFLPFLPIKIFFPRPIFIFSTTTTITSLPAISDPLIHLRVSSRFPLISPPSPSSKPYSSPRNFFLLRSPQCLFFISNYFYSPPPSHLSIFSISASVFHAQLSLSLSLFTLLAAFFTRFSLSLFSSSFSFLVPRLFFPFSSSPREENHHPLPVVVQSPCHPASPPRRINLLPSLT